MKCKKHKWIFSNLEMASLEYKLWAYFVCHKCKSFKRIVYDELD